MLEERMEEKMMDVETVNNNFSYHPPKDVFQNDKYKSLRSSGRDLAIEILSKCPDSRERSLAITKLEECIMWANASIARNE